ncbi:uncharacterized protein [Typha latifolia]|uniref:uncharacterized protein n=1 Tax=Typha latifolia TaxID=4733 RepID=UPI003C2E8B3A
MHMEVVAPAKDFNFDSANTSPYVTAPTTPARAAAMYALINDDVYGSRPSFSVHSTVPFDWEEKPGTPKSRFSPAAGDNNSCNDDDLDFAFAHGGHLKSSDELAPADELFKEGRIRPLKPPPRLQGMEDWSSVCSSPRSPRVIKGMWSPRRREREDEIDPFVAAMVEATRDSTELGSRSSRISKGCMIFLERDHKHCCSSNNNKRKWKLRDLLLFRSASEGRANLLKERETERERSTRGERNGSTRRGRGDHGEDAGKKTSLSYVQSLFGRLRSGGYSRQSV